MKFQRKEFESLDEFLSWYDEMGTQVIIFRTFGCKSIIVVFAELDCFEIDLSSSEFVC
jgi:hypothetical protein